LIYKALCPIIFPSFEREKKFLKRNEKIDLDLAVKDCHNTKTENTDRGIGK
jgi:hypothetical protein